MRRKKNGFTFVELLVAMSVFGLLTAVAVPRYRQFKERAYIASLKTDLGQLRVAQEAYWAEHLTYATSVSDLQWRPTSRVTVLITSSDLSQGYAAKASHALLSGQECNTKLGKEATGVVSGEIACGATSGGGVGIPSN